VLKSVNFFKKKNNAFAYEMQDVLSSHI